MKVDLSLYDNSWYNPGGILKRFVWYLFSIVFFQSGWFCSYWMKIRLLRLFGAKIGKGVIIKPFVNIKYPWFLVIGNNVWIGEKVWIDNLGEVVIGNNVCISQEAMVLSGNHSYSVSSFDLVIKPIHIMDGVWIGARSVVCGGVICHSHSVLSVCSVASKDLEPYSIYRGNPAYKVRSREIN